MDNSYNENFLYDIIFDSTNKFFYLYIIIIIFLIFIFVNIDFNYNILIALLFSTIIIFIIYIYRKNNFLDDKQKLEEKISIISSPTSTINNYSDIIDFLFYFKEYSLIDYNNYQKIIKQLDNFIIIYENINNNFKYINYSYHKMKKIINNILELINSIKYSSYNIKKSEILEKNKISIKIILDKYLENIIQLNNRYIYYNGYSINHNKINDEKILPFNYELI
jgi:hypothetical protein